jgi:ubiquinone/menaquinone biosynthesis C-methylase UbiE
MSDVDMAVSSYWTKRAAAFNPNASHVRHASVWHAALEQAFGPGPARRVLDLGTGTGACAIIAAELGHQVTAVDGSAGMLDVARREAVARGQDVTFVQAHILQAELEAGSFDLVTLRNVLWTVAEPQAVLARALELLSPGGRVVVADARWDRSSNRSEYDAQLAGQLPLHRGLDKAEARDMLAKAGFGNIGDFTGAFPENPYEAMQSPPFFLLSGDKP